MRQDEEDDASARERPTLVEWAKSLFAPRVQCTEDATYQTSMGPQCGRHARALMGSARSKETPLGIILQEKGIDPETWIKQHIVPMQ